MLRRIIYLENTHSKKGVPIYMEVSEQLEDISIKSIQMDAKIDKIYFDVSPNFHLENSKIIFENLDQINEKFLKENTKINEQLLDVQEEFVDFKFKQLLKEVEK